MVGFVREYEIKAGISQEANVVINELSRALRHAQEALFWHQGQSFELDGRRADFAIADALAMASRYETSRR